jgi:hypothetical protein
MPAAVLNICVDPRLDHEAIRTQVRQRLERMGRQADRIYLTNDIGGNIGSAFRNAIDVVLRSRDEIVLTGVLYHDDCLADAAGLRNPLETSRREIFAFLTNRGVTAPILTGTVVTESNVVQWSDEPRPTSEVFPFRMPRING